MGPALQEPTENDMAFRTMLVLGIALSASVAACAHGDAELSEQDKLSYALGMGQAGLLQQYGVKVDPEVYSQGLEDVLSGNPTRLSEEEARALRLSLRNDLKGRQAELRKEALAAKNRVAGEAFLAANQGKDGVVTLDNGLQYRVLQAGDGKRPTLDDTVVVNYRGTLVDGKEFANSYKRRKPKTLALAKAIPGWQAALPLMPVGSKWEIAVPPDLAYGDRQLGRWVGPGSTLVFELELVSILDPQSGEEQGAEALSAEGYGTQ